MGTTTQFVVGAQGEQDREILGLVGRLERQGLLHHAHFSAFQPVAGTPMEGLPPTPSAREFRLYQAEHLLRQYRFRFERCPSAPTATFRWTTIRRPPGPWPIPREFPVEGAARAGRPPPARARRRAARGGGGS